MLYLITTPIGNLSDVSARALETMRSIDYLLCEDTRHTQRLLNHYEIKTKLKSYHQFNEKKREQKIVDDLLAGTEVGLVSDAGVPGISDPGQILVAACRAHEIAVTAIGVGSAFLHALVVSGLPTERFQFLGFLPKKEGQLKTLILEGVANYAGVSVFYESPHRIEKTLGRLNEWIPDFRLVVARELTKMYEEVLVGTAQELLQRHQQRSFRGEIVLLIEGKSGQKKTIDLESSWKRLLEEGMSEKEAIKELKRLSGISRREIYHRFKVK